MKRRSVLMGVWLLAWLACVASVQAQTRAWLDRDRIGEGDVVTLNIETDQAGAAPDYAPLQADFSLGGRTSGRQTRMVNGSISNTALFGVVLTPRRSGVLQVPALRVGTVRTRPLQLVVDPAPVASGGDALAFVETEVDDPQPYVQQSVGVVVRLYFATQLASGELDLATPASASLQRVGQDRTSAREVGGRRYNVVERRFLLIPERSGPLRLEGARFSGRGAGGLFDDFLGRGGGTLSARSPDQTLQVRAVPDAAPQPWLPLKDLRLRYTAAPQSARVGEALTLEVEATAVGATRAQFPDLPLPAAGDAAQVFAEPAQYDESFDGAGPRLKLTRRYSIVPQRPGTLVLPGIGLRWWDVGAAEARTATLPGLSLAVAPGSAVPAPVPAASAASAAAPATQVDRAIALPGAGHLPQRLWPLLAAGFALLWLATLVWALTRRPSASPRAASVAEAAPGMATHSLADLRRALDSGDLDDVEQALRGMVRPPVADLDALAARLGSAVQREALEALRRARWAGGSGPVARAALRAAFANGPEWRGQAREPAAPLPPLYPGR
ncbi:BatD family protein [Stenotrophomonas sp. 17(2023)]|nr:BatD family protein [Stenotrophomonas sp. 17(2023)]MCA7023101.1 BatD family protein [Stenotrophomonas acidaminiphila]